MLVQRLLTAIALLCLFVGAMFVLPRAGWIAFLVPGLAVAGMEWARLAQWSRRQALLFTAVTLASFLGVLGAAATAGSAQSPSDVLMISAYVAAALFWLAAVPFWLGRGWRSRNPAILVLTGWLVLVPTWLAFVDMHASPQQFLFVAGVVWTADTAAYLVGRRFGHHRLVPTISPGKTWEGVAGAAAAVAVYYAVALVAGWPREAAWNAAGGAVVVACTAVMSVEGDLFESWMKRQAGVKDSGALLPGHGGLLDRIDGLTAGVPVAALLMHSLPAVLAA
jgi:phosphatidate cytidylyltransferase